MRVIPFNRSAAVEAEEQEPPGSWRRIAAAIDHLAGYPVKHALTERQLLYVDNEIERCRQLMSGRQPRRNAAAVPFRVSAHHALVPVKVRP